MPYEPQTIHEVIEDLIARDAPAIEDLQELQYSIRTVLQSMGQLVLASRRFYIVVATLPPPTEPSMTAPVQTVRDRAAHLNELAEEIEDALRKKVDNRICAWGVAKQENVQPLIKH